MKKIRLLLTEDHNLVRQGIGKILSQYDDISVVAEAEDGQSMIYKYNDFKPDVVLCDIEMPHMDGLTAARRILTHDKNARIIFLTVHNSDSYIYQAYKLGAFGLIPKVILEDELIDSIRTVMAGRKYFVGKTEEDLVRLKKKYDTLGMREADTEFSGLTRREKSILLYIAEGLPSSDIAERMRISKRTVDSYRAAIMAKMEIDSLPHLIRYALDYSRSIKQDSE